MVKRLLLIILTLAPALPSAGLMAMDPAQGPVPAVDPDDLPPLIDEADEQVVQDAPQAGEPAAQEDPAVADCPICLEPLQVNQPHTVSHLHEGQPGQHSFHTICIAQVRNQTCPICRAPILRQEQEAILASLIQVDPQLAQQLAQQARRIFLVTTLIIGASWTAFGLRISSFLKFYDAWKESDNEQAVSLFKTGFKMYAASFIASFIEGIGIGIYRLISPEQA